MIPELAEWLGRTRPPGGDTPWPEIPDVPLWMWEHAAPEFWRELYDRGLDYSEYISFPPVTGMTGWSYTSAPEVTANTPGWTMGQGEHFDLRVEVQGSFGYRLWQAMMRPLAHARVILDRTPARLDPLQAPEVELPRLLEWTGADPALLQNTPVPILRRYALLARAIERVRGTEASMPLLGEVLGLGITMHWASEPHLRTVSVRGEVDEVARRFLRRYLPAHLGARVYSGSGLVAYTGRDYTARSVREDRTVPPESILAITSTQSERVELL